MTGGLGSAQRVKAAIGLGTVLVMAALAAGPAHADAGGPPEIRASAGNRVPACVTPERLMGFIAAHNDQLPARYSGIATAYRDLGDAYHIRWDYAFYQMVLETNYLRFKRGDGSSGDVSAGQNNFAGIGATGGGVAGERFPDIRTGVAAQMQHLVAYSGEKVDRPVAQRTREHQDDIIEISRKLGRPVKFGDLANRWAADRSYARSIEVVADLFRRAYCTGITVTGTGQPPATAFVQPSKLGAATAGDAMRPTGEHEATAPHRLVRIVWRRGDLMPPEPRRAESRKPVAAAPAGGAPAVATMAAPSQSVTLAASLPVPAPVAAVRAARTAPDANDERAVVPADASLSAVSTITKPQLTGVARFAQAAEAAVATGAIPAPGHCRIYSASYGGSAALLIRAKLDGEVRLTALGVEDRSSRSMGESFLASHAPGGAIIGSFSTRDGALSAARALCPAD